MLKDLVEKVDNMCEQIGIFSREQGAIKEQNGNAKYRKYDNRRILSSTDLLANETFKKLKGSSVEIIQIQTQRGKREGVGNRASKSWENLSEES